MTDPGDKFPTILAGEIEPLAVTTPSARISSITALRTTQAGVEPESALWEGRSRVVV